jgi:hypothetical protein
MALIVPGPPIENACAFSRHVGEACFEVLQTALRQSHLFERHVDVFDLDMQ